MFTSQKNWGKIWLNTHFVDDFDELHSWIQMGGVAKNHHQAVMDLQIVGIVEFDPLKVETVYKPFNLGEPPAQGKGWMAWMDGMGWS